MELEIKSICQVLMKKVTIVGYTDNAYFGVAPVVYMGFDAFSELMQADKQQRRLLVVWPVPLSFVEMSPQYRMSWKKLPLQIFIEYLPGYKAQNITFGFMIGFLVVISAIVIGILSLF